MDQQQKTNKSTGIWTAAVMAAVTLGGLILAITSFGDPFNYARFTWSLLLLWAGAIWLRLLKDRLVERVGPHWAARRTAWRRLPFNAFISLAPGLILMWYGLAAPANPTLTRGGFDVCELSVGYCVSGTRAIAYFGAFGLLIGLGLVYLQYRQAQRHEVSPPPPEDIRFPG